MFKIYLIDVVVITVAVVSLIASSISHTNTLKHSWLLHSFIIFLTPFDIWKIVSAADAVICLSNGHAHQVYVISTMWFELSVWNRFALFHRQPTITLQRSFSPINFVISRPKNANDFQIKHTNTNLSAINRATKQATWQFSVMLFFLSLSNNISWW